LDHINLSDRKMSIWVAAITKANSLNADRSPLSFLTVHCKQSLVSKTSNTPRDKKEMDLYLLILGETIIDGMHHFKEQGAYGQISDKGYF